MPNVLNTPPVLVLTNPGYDALVNAKKDGLSGVTIAAIGLTATPFVPDADMTELPNELKRLNTIAGGATSRATLHVQIRDESADAYEAYGLGLFLDNGVMLGVYGQAAPLMAKSGQATAFWAVDIAFANIDARLIQFGDTNFQVPAATEETVGVIRIATLAECRAGTVPNAAVTPAGLAAVRYYPGQIVVTAGKKPPPGTLVMDGSYLSIAQYPDLYDAIGTLYGSNGADTFRLPLANDGEVSLETALPSLVGGRTSGQNIAHTHAASAMPGGAHKHDVAVTEAGLHGHSASATAGGSHLHGAWTDQQGWHAHAGATAGQNANHRHISGFKTVGVQLGNSSINTVGDFNGVSAGATGDELQGHAHAFGTDGAGTHAHNVGMDAAPAHTHSVSVAQDGQHKHPVAEQMAPDHDHEVAVQLQGSARNYAAGTYRLTCIAF